MSIPPRHRRLVHAAPLLAVVVASGAGCDSLLGEAGLGGTFVDVSTQPADIAWELRWFDGSGMRSQCDLLPPGEGDVLFDHDFGALELPPPDPTTPVGAMDEGTFTWALAALVLVDADPATDRPAGESDPLASVWGIAPLHGILHLSGDVDAFTEALEIQELQGAVGLVAGFQTVEIFPQQIVGDGSFEGAIAAVDPSISFTDEPGAVVADPVDFVDPSASQLVAGEGLGGLTFEACP